MRYVRRSLHRLGFSSGLVLLLIQPVTAQSSSLFIATSCLPGGADAPLSQGMVINREQIEAQTRFNQDLDQILTTEVPGFLLVGNHNPLLRGQPVRILVDGVPVTADDSVLSTLSPDLIERIEVIPGPSILCQAIG